MNEWNFLGDIHGREDKLIELRRIMPDVPFFCLGDLIDRGLFAKQVVEYVMKYGRSLKGNHEALMIDYAARPSFSSMLWLHERNGGGETLKSYGWRTDPKNPGFSKEDYKVFEEHAAWMQDLPHFHKEEGLIVTHAPIAPWVDMEEFNGDMSMTVRDHILWNNRAEPIKRDVFQIHGHTWHYKKYGDWGMCIDDMANGKLMGVHWPSLKTYSV